jgi:hypothetical protein
MEDVLLDNNTAPSRAKQRSTFVQTKLPFQSISRGEWEAQERARYARFQEQCQIEREREALEKAQARLAQMTYQRLCKRDQRTLHQAAQIHAGIRSPDGKLKVCARNYHCVCL